MGKRVADALVDTLAAHGVQRFYGVAGDSLNGNHRLDPWP
jgi:thiamine pyrophosphate-dependent acetolactate synthase large subunit-like protein